VSCRQVTQPGPKPAGRRTSPLAPKPFLFRLRASQDHIDALPDQLRDRNASTRGESFQGGKLLFGQLHLNANHAMRRPIMMAYVLALLYACRLGLSTPACGPAAADKQAAAFDRPLREAGPQAGVDRPNLQA